jgi:hypothetical protein
MVRVGRRFVLPLSRDRTSEHKWPITRSALSRSRGSRGRRLQASLRNHSSSRGTSSSDIAFSLRKKTPDVSNLGTRRMKVQNAQALAYGRGLPASAGSQISKYKSIAALLNFDEPGAVLLPLLGRRSRPPRPESFEEFIHLGPRQIHNVGALRGGIETLCHGDNSLADGSSARRSSIGIRPAPRQNQRGAELGLLSSGRCGGYRAYSSRGSQASLCRLSATVAKIRPSRPCDSALVWSFLAPQPPLAGLQKGKFE